jgi:predicted metal-dependent hydrolase
MATSPEDRVVQLDGRSKVYRPLPFDERRAAVLAGLALYADGEAFEAHEAWEPAWMGTDDVAERALLQGLIKIAAAAVHDDRGNPPGVVRNLEGALERLSAASAVGVTAAPGVQVDLARLIADAEAWLAVARRGERHHPVPIPWRPA